MRQRERAETCAPKCTSCKRLLGAWGTRPTKDHGPTAYGSRVTMRRRESRIVPRDGHGCVARNRVLRDAFVARWSPARENLVAEALRIGYANRVAHAETRIQVLDLSPWPSLAPELET